MAFPRAALDSPSHSLKPPTQNTPHPTPDVVRDTSCCCHPLTGAPCSCLGQRTPLLGLSPLQGRSLKVNLSTYQGVTVNLLAAEQPAGAGTDGGAEDEDNRIPTDFTSRDAKQVAAAELRQV